MASSGMPDPQGSSSGMPDSEVPNPRRSAVTDFTLVVGAGRTGTAVVARLAGEGREVVVIDDAPLPAPEGSEKARGKALRAGEMSGGQAGSGVPGVSVTPEGTVIAGGNVIPKGTVIPRGSVIGKGTVISGSGGKASRHRDASGNRRRRGARALSQDLAPGPIPDGGVRANAPNGKQLAKLVAAAARVVVSPGVPPRHPVFSLAGPKIVSELQLGRERLSVPLVAVTGTNGKTTVVTLVTEMLRASGMKALSAGNIGLPLISVDDSACDVVVAEVSSFQLATTTGLAPAVGAWLNFEPDHLDWHPDLASYRSAKARIFQGMKPGGVIVACAGDAVVMEEATAASVACGARIVMFDSVRTRPGGGQVSRPGGGEPGKTARQMGREAEAVGLEMVRLDIGGGRAGSVIRWTSDEIALKGPDGEEVIRITELQRSFPHDLEDMLASLAIATSAGASLAGCRQALAGFRGLPHRVELVGEVDGVRYYDDSKATTPTSTVRALEGVGAGPVGGVVLIAGGRNKDLDLSGMALARPAPKTVVAIGEAAREVAAVFAGLAPVVFAGSMAEAVVAATSAAGSGDAVLLSPGCTSFDWYGSYEERGDDFRRIAEERAGARSVRLQTGKRVKRTAERATDGDGPPVENAR